MKKKFPFLEPYEKNFKIRKLVKKKFPTLEPYEKNSKLGNLVKTTLLNSELVAILGK